MKRHILLFAMILASFPSLPAGEEDLASFQVIWETVKEKHWDLAGTGVDWDEMHRRYEPLVKAAESSSDARRLMTEMLGNLGQSHFGIMGAHDNKALESLNDLFPGGSGVPGFEVALVEQRVFVVKINLDYDSAKKGMGIGTEILALRGKKLGPVVDQMLTALKDSKNKELFVGRTLNGFFTGTKGSKLNLKVRMDGKEKELAVVLAAPKGIYKSMLNLDGLRYHYHSEMLKGNQGLIAFNLFLPDLNKDLAKDLTGRFANTDGLIIDLRGNPGGMAMMASSLAARLIKEKGKTLGQMTNPGGTLKFPIFPQKPGYDRPVAILIDGSSASTSEIVAQGLRDLGRVRLFGTQSAGAALPSVVVPLPNGDQFQYAMADYISLNGHHVEGAGVAPDERTPHTLESMSQGKDATLEAAQAWIRKENEGAKRESM